MSEVKASKAGVDFSSYTETTTSVCIACLDEDTSKLTCVDPDLKAVYEDKVPHREGEGERDSRSFQEETYRVHTSQSDSAQIPVRRTVV